MSVRRKTSRITNEILSIWGQQGNPQSEFNTKYSGDRDVVVSEMIKKYKLKERRVKFLLSSLKKKIG